MADVQKLHAALEFITKNRSAWNQGVWTVKNECGTTACLAGWGAIMFARDQLEEKKYGNGLAEYIPINKSWTDLGMDVFDLDEGQADEIFFDSNSLLDLWQFASDFTNGAIQVPSELPNEE